MTLEQTEPTSPGMYTVMQVLLCALAAVVLMPPSSQGVLYYVQAREHVMRILAGALGVALCWGWFTGRVRPRPGFGHGLLLAFVAHAALAVSWSLDKQAALESVHGYVCWFLVALAACEVFRVRGRFAAFTRWLALVALLVGTIGVLEKAGLIPNMVPDLDSLDQIASTLGYPTYYAAWLLPSLFLLQAGIAAADNRTDKGFCAAAFALLCVNLWLCHSQAALGFFVVAEAVFVIGPGLMSRASSRFGAALRIFAPVLCVIAAALVFVLLLHPFMDRKQESMELRRMKWQVAGAMAQDRPLSGFGPGQYPVYYPRYRARLGLQEGAWETRPDIYYPVVTDNDFLMRVVEQGWPGAALFAALIAWTILYGAGRGGGGPPWRRTARSSVAAGVFAVAGFGLFHFPFESTGGWFPLWCCFAAAWAFSSRDPAPAQEQITTRRRPLARAAVFAALFCAAGYAAYLPAGQWFDEARMMQGYRDAVNRNEPAALRAIHDSAPLVPDTWRRHYYGGRTLLLIGRPRQAAAFLRRAEELRPYNLTVLNWLRAAMMFNPAENRTELERVNRRIRVLNPDGNEPPG